MTEDRVDLEWLRWLYTALTRAERELYLLNFADVFSPEARQEKNPKPKFAGFFMEESQFTQDIQPYTPSIPSRSCS